MTSHHFHQLIYTAWEALPHPSNNPWHTVKKYMTERDSTSAVMVTESATCRNTAWWNNILLTIAENDKKSNNLKPSCPVIQMWKKTLLSRQVMQWPLMMVNVLMSDLCNHWGVTHLYILDYDFSNGVINTLNNLLKNQHSFYIPLGRGSKYEAHWTRNVCGTYLYLFTFHACIKYISCTQICIYKQ